MALEVFVYIGASLARRILAFVFFSRPYVDEEALIAFEDSLELTTISGSIKELLTSGEGFVYAIKGKGRLWLQTREKSDESSGGGLADGLFSFLK